MKVLVVDDEPLARAELIYLLEKIDSVSQIQEADSVIDAMERIMDDKPDIVFLDIHLTDESGFDLAEKFTQMKKPPKVIFATAYDDYALKAFEVNAVDYVLKPFEEKRIKQALAKISEDPESEKEESKMKGEGLSVASLALQVNDRIVVINPKEILYASVDNGELTIVLNNQCYEITETLSWLEKKLASNLFFKTHRSYLVNLLAIKEVQPWFNHTYQITLLNGQKIPVSRSYVKELKERIGL
ncbi:LytTR family transcriptional regulator DNA-binding domain-containing protein [Vagococcus intermedius]|uniref:LytTR family transcriptional regulator DNA-binding domain-containing protein n=1 Tax=Vagococcus intermedius TaxID=2991418 RepID=A0AAF0CW28_9ENTE|nr:LytTR family transcriptional regulator DNA-binding domain-containing protein [Vagococcus intermedius]WEG73896.1 LytTR family transcriptional regulator DNA-binding domain-containing protein [Vagococcus intermedius]WEG75980.1 LytTR family transcriptional regulator DNA-binding domain-containing protein [Vagococcus intermedius]